MTEATLLDQWCSEKGITQTTLLLAGVHVADHELRFRYTHLDSGHEYVRYYDLAAWRANQKHRFWIKGSKALGSAWIPDGQLPKTAEVGVLLCEGETDALAAMQVNPPFLVVCLPGASTFGASLWGYLAPFPRVIAAFDSDSAGKAGLDRLNRFRRGGSPPLYQLSHAGQGDLRDLLRISPDWRAFATQCHPVAPAQPREATSQYRSPWITSPFANSKPDLFRVWLHFSPRTKRESRDGQGRVLREAWCPLHDDGENPGAWVGEHRWGCWVCGIESADVYELVAWATGITPPGTPLTGADFHTAKQRARELG